MNNKEIKEMDNVIAALGEITLLKSSVNSFDENISITLADKTISKILSQSEIFDLIEKVQKIKLSIHDLNVDLLGLASKVSKIPNLAEEKVEPVKKVVKKVISKGKEQNNSAVNNNPIVNNVLDYLQDIIEEGDKGNE